MNSLHPEVAQATVLKRVLAVFLTSDPRPNGRRNSPAHRRLAFSARSAVFQSRPQTLR